MAISVENADLYADLERRVIERTRALEEAQARLVKLEKEATETRMAGGFAHEMRNALTSARLVVEKVYGTDGAGEIWSVCRQTSATLVQLYPMIRAEEREPAAGLLSEVNSGQRQLDQILGTVGRALTHALAITNQILDYSRLGKERAGDSLVPLRPLLESIIEESADDFAAHTIAVEVDIAEGSALPGKTIHFYSILKNLILNARDALLEKTNGDRRRAIRITLAEEPYQCMLRISDTGAGIPAEHRDKLFEPFFSTKPDTGTGLGLAVVRKLVAVHDGSIQVESELGRGTTFTIVLPRREQPLPA
jgi:signal transduction histidine kinase